MNRADSDNFWESWLIVVPARLASKRLARKPLVDLGGKPLIQRVYENLAPLAARGADLRVATDSNEILAACERADIRVELSSSEHASGSDRCYELASKTSHPFIMNVQGDEPFASLADLDRLASLLAGKASSKVMATLVYESSVTDQYLDPSSVKVVRARDGRALYFSRALIPYRDETKSAGTAQVSIHQGVYAFSREALKQFCSAPRGDLEITEGLEQLRALEHGIPIYTAEATEPSLGIDTASDLERAREILGR